MKTAPMVVAFLLSASTILPTAHAGPFSAANISTLEDAVKDVPWWEIDEFKDRVEAAGKRVEGFARIPNLSVDTRARDLRLDILHAHAWGGISVDLDSRSHMGGLPSASLALSDQGRAASLSAEVSHDLRRISLGGNWDFAGAALTAAVDQDGRYEAGLSVPFAKLQSFSYRVRSGPAADHSVGWSMRVRL